MKITIFCLAVVFTVMSFPVYAEEETTATAEGEKKPSWGEIAMGWGEGLFDKAGNCIGDPKECLEKAKQKGIEFKDKAVEIKDGVVRVGQGGVKLYDAGDYALGVIKTPSRWILCTSWQNQFAFASLFLVCTYWFRRKKKVVGKDGSVIGSALGIFILSFICSRGCILLNELAENSWLTAPDNPEEVKAGATVITKYTASLFPHIIKWLPLVFPFILFLKRRWIFEAVSAIKHEGFKGLKSHLNGDMDEVRTDWVVCASPTCDCKNPLEYSLCQRCRTLSPNANLSEILAKQPKKGDPGSPPSISDNAGWTL